MHLFYQAQASGKQIVLNEEESRHCCKVLRLKAGDVATVINGLGQWFDCEIEQAHDKHSILKVLHERKEQGKNYHLHVAIAPTKNIDRYEWFVEKATELGVDEISPIICQRSERKELRVDRVNKVITAAVKQSLTAYHPKLNEAISWKNFVSKQDAASAKYIAHCHDSAKQEFNKIVRPQGSIIICIGPEGDFNPQELELAIQHQFIPVSLGSSRLRTETAGILTCATLRLAAV